MWGRKRVLHNLVTKVPSLPGQALAGSVRGFPYDPSGDSGSALVSHPGGGARQVSVSPVGNC